jgi:uncharacterized protein YodC (DUF2158 family)
MYPGDVVRLKSGGPKMVVASIEIDDDDGESMATCWWYSEKPVFTNDDSEAEEGFVERDIPIIVLEVVAAAPQKKKPKLLVTERDSDIEAAKHELDEYLSKKRGKK